VRRAWLDIQETRRRLDVTAEAIQRAEENLRVARTRYLAGMGISTEVLDAEALRTQTRQNRDNAAYDAVLAVLRLRHAMGELAP
jgi:outer membrane protein